MTNFQRLYDRHHRPGLTGSYHGDMAAACAMIRTDTELDAIGAEDLTRAVRAHLATERDPRHKGRRWFCEQFGTAAETIREAVYDERPDLRPEEDAE